MLDELKPAAHDTVLEVGCGTGRNLILAARRYPKAKFYGLDISNEMLTTAWQSVKRSGLSDRITLAQGDARTFDVREMFGIVGADRVFVSYTLSMIPSWHQSLDASLSAVASSGSFHIVDFGQQNGLPKWFKATLFAWLDKFTVYPCADLRSELSIRAEASGFDLRYQHLYCGYADYAVLRHI